MKYKNILWDWNGTLIDDVGVALEAVNIMLERRSLPKINIGQYYSYVDTPIIRFYEKCFDMTKDDEGTLLPEYQRLYAELAQELPKNDTTYKTVKALQDKRFRQFIVSSCEQNILNNWLARYGITHFFEAVTGADNLCAESKTERAIHLMENYGLEPSETVFVGDTAHDFDTAKALGVDTLLVTYGHQSPEENRNTGCVTANSLDEVLAILTNDANE